MPVPRQPRRSAEAVPTAFVGRLRASLTALSVALLASYFVLVLLQVFFRYVLNESLFWAEELVRGADGLGRHARLGAGGASRATISGSRCSS